MSKKVEFDHKADKLSNAIIGVDRKAAADLFAQMVTDGEKVFGDTKSMTAEWIQEHANDPNALLALAQLVNDGAKAMYMMHMLEEKTKDAMKKMDIHPDMPQEMKDAIRKAKAEDKKTVSGDTKTSDTEEVDDEFEKLKSKYA